MPHGWVWVGVGVCEGVDGGEFVGGWVGVGGQIGGCGWVCELLVGGWVGECECVGVGA